jgi:uncharacterized protein
MYQLSELWVYPIKSMAGVPMSGAFPEIRGLQHDRRWMLIDPEGRFVSQREIPELATYRINLSAGFLEVFPASDETQKLKIPLSPDLEAMEKTRVEVWGDSFKAALLSATCHEWFSDHFGQKLRLVQMPETTHRWADGRYAPKGQHVSFADGFPYLIIGQASLDDLNSRLESPVPMNRFRPNFVFTGGTPFEEDSWKHFSIGDNAFMGVKPCARCTIITTDQQTGARAAEPLKTLATYRKEHNKVRFGQNVVWLGTHTAPEIRVGDTIRVG